jgi:hypothetical protein
MHIPSSCLRATDLGAKWLEEINTFFSRIKVDQSAPDFGQGIIAHNGKK